MRFFLLVFSSFLFIFFFFLCVLQEVAKEMIDELMLNISVPSLSAQIESLVRDALRVVGVDNRDLSELAEDGAVSSTDLLVKDDQNVDTPLESCASNSNAENMSEQMLPLTISLILNDHVGNDSEDRESVDHQVNPDLKENAEVSVSSEIPTTFAEPEAPVILSVDVDHQSKMDRGDCGDEEFLKELEKIEKEARVAKRAFDQRIQKHKEIQVLTFLLHFYSDFVGPSHVAIYYVCFSQVFHYLFVLKSFSSISSDFFTLGIVLCRN